MIIDLSHRLTAQSLPFPGDPEFTSVPVLTQDNGGFNVLSVSFSTHWGTHLDAPAHIDVAAGDVASIPLATLYGNCICIPLNREKNIEPDSEITLDQILPFAPLLKQTRKILFQTGWSEKWDSLEYFNHAPGFTLDALRFLAQTPIELLGVDLPSPVREQDELAGHQILLNNNICILENLANLHQLPPAPQEFILSALPPAIENLDGFPVRAVAILDQ